MCFLWGTTYLAIRMSLETFPPLVLVTVRYLLSGSIMLVFARSRGLYIPRGRELAAACVSGFLTLGIGNGALVFAEVLVPSGIASLITSISPFWMVAAEALLPGGERSACSHARRDGGGTRRRRPSFHSRPRISRHQSLRSHRVPDPATRDIRGAVVRLDLPAPKSGKAHPVVAGGVQQLAAALIFFRSREQFHNRPCTGARAASRRSVTW